MQRCRLTVALIAILAGGAHAAKDSCFDCHRVMEGTSIVFKDDVHYHNTISCADCHGGDPREDDQNISMSAGRGFKVRVTRQQTPAYCGHCHSDTNYLHQVKPQPGEDLLALYLSSVHGRALAAGRTKSAECVDCHGVHNIRPVSDPLSPAHPQHVTETCARCHAETADAFRKSPHARMFNTAKMPGCAACHSSHATAPAGDDMLAGGNAVCAQCHDAGSDADKAAAEMASLLAGLENAGPASKEALARARAAAHTCDVAAVRRAAESTVAGPEAGRK